MGGVRSTVSRQLSGIAMQTERELLNARLSQKADNLELAEEHIWRLWAMWQGKVFDGVIDYPDSFNIHDKENTVALLKLAKETNPSNEQLLKEIDIMLAKALIKDEDTLERVIEAQQEQQVNLDTTTQHTPMTSPTQMVEHMKAMVEQGYTTEQILELHPEIQGFFNGGTDDA